jgi:hypothetical protein
LQHRCLPPDWQWPPSRRRVRHRLSGEGRADWEGSRLAHSQAQLRDGHQLLARSPAVFSSEPDLRRAAAVALRGAFNAARRRRLEKIPGRNRISLVPLNGLKDRGYGERPTLEGTIHPILAWLCRWACPADCGRVPLARTEVPRTGRTAQRARPCCRWRNVGTFSRSPSKRARATAIGPHL